MAFRARRHHEESGIRNNPWASPRIGRDLHRFGLAGQRQHPSRDATGLQLHGAGGLMQWECILVVYALQKRGEWMNLIIELEQ